MIYIYEPFVHLVNIKEMIKMNRYFALGLTLFDINGCCLLNGLHGNRGGRSGR